MLRVNRCDGFFHTSRFWLSLPELRDVVGGSHDQTSVGRGRRSYGEKLCPIDGESLTHTFPTPERLAQADLAQYIAMRVLREPDAFRAADIGLMRALTPRGGARPAASEVLARAEAWRPWRAYAAQHLWTGDAEAVRASARTNSKEG